MNPDDLRKLEELRDKGILSEEEFQTKKALFEDDVIIGKQSDEDFIHSETSFSSGKRFSFNQEEKNVFFWYKHAFRHFADFKGRAHRKEFWSFFLVNTLIFFVLAIPDILFPWKGFLLSDLYHLIVFIPNLSLFVRRLHDTNHSGFLLLLPVGVVIPLFLFGSIAIVSGLLLSILYVFYFCFAKGDEGTNKYGEKPI